MDTEMVTFKLKSRLFGAKSRVFTWKGTISASIFAVRFRPPALFADEGNSWNKDDIIVWTFLNYSFYAQNSSRTELQAIALVLI
jgi:hypothetical protein